MYTPEGLRKKSTVHHVEHGCHLSKENGRMKKIETKTGRVIEDYGQVVPSSASEVDRNNTGATSQAIDSTFGSGWITYAYWNNTSNPISYFSTNWIVPSAPTTHNGQTIFLFSGIDPATPSDAILQPVLQWGPSAAGGGNYWAITNWYVEGSGQSYYGDSLIKVNPGTNLQGIMALTAQDTDYSYSSTFTGYPNCSIQVNKVPQLTWANQTMEIYGITKYTDYPADSAVRMSSIQMKTGTANATSLKWTPKNVVTDVGQHTIVVSSSPTNGDVDLYFHTPTHNATGINKVSNNNLSFDIYPNPASDAIIVERSTTSIQNGIVSIKNMQGQEVINEKINFAGTTYAIDLNNLSNGVYILTLQSEKENYVRKIIIQK